MGIINKLKGTINEALGYNESSKENGAQQISDATDSVETQKQSANMGIYDPQLEKLIELALADGELTEKEKQVLFRKAQSMGIDLDEFEMVLDARLYERNNSHSTQKSGSTAQKLEKGGYVKRCNSCGATIDGFTACCPYCGSTLSNIAANTSIQKLFEMLNQVETMHIEKSKIWSILDETEEEKRTRIKKTMIQNFPIPNTKEDIIEFLSLTLPLAKPPKKAGFWTLDYEDEDDEREELRPVWKAKCEQVIMKAKFLMQGDRKLLEMIGEYAKELGIKM